MGKVIYRLFPSLKKECDLLLERIAVYSERLGDVEAALLRRSEELRLAKDRIKFLEAQGRGPQILRAKTAAEVRRIVEEQNEREFEESAKNGI